MNEMKNTIVSCNSRLNSTEEIIYEPEDRSLTVGSIVQKK